MGRREGKEGGKKRRDRLKSGIFPKTNT